MIVLACLALLAPSLPQESGPPELEVEVAVRPDSPVAGEPIKIVTTVKYVGQDMGVLVSGLKMRAPEVWICEMRGKTAGPFARVDRGADSPAITEKRVLSPGGTYRRHDVLSENLKTKAPVFTKAGTYRLKVKFQGAESRPVTVEVKAADESESEAVQKIQAAKLHRHWSTIPTPEEYRPEVAMELGDFLYNFRTSRFRPLAAYALAQLWNRHDAALAEKEKPEETRKRRERTLELFKEASNGAPILLTECDIQRAQVHLKLGHGGTALQYLVAAVDRNDAQEWMDRLAQSLLRDVRNKKEARDPSLDWKR